MARAMAMHMRELETQYNAEAAEQDGETKPYAGIAQADLIVWYLKEFVLSDVSTEEQLAGYQELVARVIDRLVQVDRVLLQTDAEAVADVNQRHLVVHPNYVP